MDEAEQDVLFQMVVNQNTAKGMSSATSIAIAMLKPDIVCGKREMRNDKRSK
jgi:hypothetical protein